MKLNQAEMVAKFGFFWTLFELSGHNCYARFWRVYEQQMWQELLMPGLWLGALLVLAAVAARVRREADDDGTGMKIMHLLWRLFAAVWLAQLLCRIPGTLAVWYERGPFLVREWTIGWLVRGSALLLLLWRPALLDRLIAGCGYCFRKRSSSKESMPS